MKQKQVGTIIGTGAYIPPRTIDNSEIATMVETSDAWIRERTGVLRRHVTETETTGYMAIRAAERALENGNVSPEEIDMIIVSTVSGHQLFPCMACQVQQAIQATHATCFDINAACAGFVFALQAAQAYIESNMAKVILLIGSENLSNLVDWTDRSTCILFGDGAGAAVLKAKESGLFEVRTASDGTGCEVLRCESRHIKKEKDFKGEDYLRMDGQAVFRFALKTVPASIEEVLREAQISTDEVDWFILHQANGRIIEGAAKRLGVPIEKCPMNISEYGNTSSASIPILLDEMHRDGRLQRGQKIVISGFGAGLSWGTLLTEW